MDVLHLEPANTLLLAVIAWSLREMIPLWRALGMRTKALLDHFAIVDPVPEPAGKKAKP